MLIFQEEAMDVSQNGLAQPQQKTPPWTCISTQCNIEGKIA